MCEDSTPEVLGIRSITNLRSDLKMLHDVPARVGGTSFSAVCSFGALVRADKGQTLFLASRETVDRCHGIACRRFSGRADFRLRRLNGRAARPVIRGHCVGHFCRSGPYYRRGPSGWGRLGSQTRNDGF